MSESLSYDDLLAYKKAAEQVIKYYADTDNKQDSVCQYGDVIGELDDSDFSVVGDNKYGTKYYGKRARQFQDDWKAGLR